MTVLFAFLTMISCVFTAVLTKWGFKPENDEWDTPSLFAWSMTCSVCCFATVVCAVLTAASL
jgi:hypothetical protein